MKDHCFWKLDIVSVLCFWVLSSRSNNSHLKLISRTAFFHLHKISKIRHVLSEKNAETLVHAFVTSRLDYCNSLLSGSSSKSLKTLQLVQNAPRSQTYLLSLKSLKVEEEPELSASGSSPVESSQVQFRRQTSSQCLRVGFKPSFNIKLIVRAGPDSS